MISLKSKCRTESIRKLLLSVQRRLTHHGCSSFVSLTECNLLQSAISHGEGEGDSSMLQMKTEEPELAVNLRTFKKY